jgi:hypothetical protein
MDDAERARRMILSDERDSQVTSLRPEFIEPEAVEDEHHEWQKTLRLKRFACHNLYHQHGFTPLPDFGASF